MKYSKRIKWLEDEMELLRKVWPEMGAASTSLFPRHEASATIKKASFMGLKFNRPKTPAETIEEMAKREHGVGTEDMPEKKKLFYFLTDQKRIFTSDKRLGRHAKRFFDTKERAEAYYAAWEPPKLPATNKKTPPVGTVLRKAGSASTPIPKLVTGGPARLPGEPLITEFTKITIAPPPPARIWKSNTFSGAY